MLGEGLAAPSVEQAGLQAGYPTGPLALLDEVSLTLSRRIREEARAAAAEAGVDFPDHPAFPVMDRMVTENDRGGRAAGAGFYDYVDGKRTGLWSGLVSHFADAVR